MHLKLSELIGNRVTLRVKLIKVTCVSIGIARIVDTFDTEVSVSAIHFSAASVSIIAIPLDSIVNNRAACHTKEPTKTQE